MFSSSTSKNAPFSRISTALPLTARPCVRPDSDAVSLSSGASVSTLRCGSRCRLIDQMTTPRRTTAHRSSSDNTVMASRLHGPLLGRGDELAQQGLRMHRLDQVKVEARGERAPAVLRLAVRRHGNQARKASAGLAQDAG